jgi:transposase
MRPRKEAATDEEVTAMRASSMDLRERVAAAVDDGQLPQRQIARLFRVSLSFVPRLLKRRREAGTLAAEPHRGGPRRVLGAAERCRLWELVEEHNDDTLDELRRRGGSRCSLTTIWRALRRLGLTRKQKSLHADERDRDDVKRKRRTFRRKVRRIEPGRLRFVDESGANTAMARAHAWAPRGVRAVGSAPGGWESFTVIAALGLDGVSAPLVLPGSIDAAAFDSYVADVLAPALRPGDVVVWDNLPAHQGRAAAAAVRQAGARLMFLSPYSPDYTPIERLWSKVKTYLRRLAARSKESLYGAISEALESVTAQDIIGWFEHAGLYAMQG